MSWLAKILGKKKPAPAVHVEYDEPPFPMLPKFVVEAAVDGGWPFTGNIGPQQILDVRLFRALVKSQLDRTDWDRGPGIEIKAKEMAHLAYDFYLRFFEMTPEQATAAATDFWRSLLKRDLLS